MANMKPMTAGTYYVADKFIGNIICVDYKINYLFLGSRFYIEVKFYIIDINIGTFERSYILILCPPFERSGMKI